MTRRIRFQRFILRVLAMSAKEVLHIRRDPRTLFLALGMPVVLLLIFGYGVSFDIERMPLAIVDGDRTGASRALVDALTSHREFIAVDAANMADAERLVHRSEAVAILVVPHGYERALARRGPSPTELIVDGTDPVVANQILAKADAVTRAFNLQLTAVPWRRPPLQVNVWTRYNPTGRSSLFMVPGLGAYLLAVSAVLLTALTVAGEWERGSMEQLFASPVGRLEIVFGKLLPFLVLATGAAAFDLPLRGNLVLLFVIGFFFLVGMLGQGLLISVVTRNQLVATQAGALSSLLPSMLLSGMVFPIENMPKILQWLSAVIPARYLVHAMRSILLKGSGLAMLWPDLLAQILFGAVIIGLAIVRFRRRLA